ncbi:bacillithiol biosynthesis deacetylase BshB1 [Zeaxanthinibacter enoshimensis]|uniref:Bacillithiol biosynthesis deacetylase BshB1 n=1 Tax=Zeaxanthinibacter enoshimensis TaxID=392009 RepID=A0A4R6TRZ5_9FLAO|nr:bacillithiol biosynthesis deacetylase BshB1 [Zeaxanthinibacter enoshimensis]TDQ31250.1 bacillithiol biosynthesis deacetylase BshB1 [Zeaxanthinibacter enoshimensis]
MKLDILVFGAHPDDAELSVGATIAKEVDRGKKVGIIDLTRGELGTRGSAEIRDREAAKAAEILGISVRENMEFADGFFVNDKEHQMALIRMIRKYRPEIVLCNAIRDRHIDHGRGSSLVSDACFLSGLLKIDTRMEGDDQWQDPWRPKQVYHYIQWMNLEPDFVIDVTGYMDTKLKAIAAYSSQFYDPDNKAPDTPISSKNFQESIGYRARDLGRLVGVEYAEGFTAERVIAADSLGDIF